MADPYKNNVVLYLPMEGSHHGDTVILDRTGKTVTRNGDVILSTTVAPPFGTTSAYFDGTGDSLQLSSAELDLNTAATYTVEFWYRTTALPAAFDGFFFCGNNLSVSNANRTQCGVNYQGAVNFYLEDGSAGGDNAATATGTIQINTWYHIAAVLTSAYLYVFIDGVLKAFASRTKTLTASSTFYVGVARSGGEVENLLGYIKDLRITKGIARYTANFFVSQTTTVDDDYWANVVLAIHGEGTGTTFTDVSNGARTITTSGNTTHSTAVAPPFGTSSIYFDGSGDYLSLTTGSDFSFDTNDFTIEGWLRVTNYSTVRAVVSKYTTWSSNIDFYLYVNTDGKLRFVAGDSGPIALPSDAAVPTATWFHFAVCRAAGTTCLFIDGVAQSTTHSGSVNIPNDKTTLRIGINSETTPIEPFLGYMKDLRVTAGVARYTQNFNPWRVQDPYYKDSVLLISGEGSGATFTDGSPTPKTITANGNATHSSTVAPPFGSTSIYFDGSGDYLLLGGQSDFAFGTADFTLEFWVRHSVASTYEAWYDSRPTSTQGSYVAFYRNGDNSVRLYVNSADRITSDITLTINTWYHLALVRFAGTTKIYINGVAQSQSYADSNNYLNGTTRPVIGAVGDDLATLNFNGYLKDLRVIKGAAKYTTNFTPAKVPAQTKSNGMPVPFPDKTAIRTIAAPVDWDNPEPVRIML